MGRRLPFFAALAALCATGLAQSAERVEANRHAAETSSSDPAPLRNAFRQRLASARIVSAQSAPIEADTRLRDAVLHIRLGDAVVLERIKGPSGPGTRSPLRAPLGGILTAYDDARFGEAHAHYSRAARCSGEAAEVVMAHAATSPAPHTKVRALRALRDVPRVGPGAPRSDRVLQLLLVLCIEPEPVRTEAVGLLELWCQRGAHDLRPHVHHVLQAWPADRESLRLGEFQSGGCCPGSHYAPENAISRLVLIASTSGDVRVIDRLLERPAGKLHPSDDHVDFVLSCLKSAAPSIDVRTARRLHDLFLAELRKVSEVPPMLLSRRHRAVADLFVALHPRLPGDVLPPLDALFDREGSNGLSSYRQRLAIRR